MICEMKGCGEEVKNPIIFHKMKLCRDCYEEWQAILKDRKSNSK